MTVRYAEKPADALVWHASRCSVCRIPHQSCTEWYEILHEFGPASNGYKMGRPGGPPPAWREEWDNPDDAAYDAVDEGAKVLAGASDTEIDGFLDAIYDSEPQADAAERLAQFVEPPVSLVYLHCQKCDGFHFYLTGLALMVTCATCGEQYPSRVNSSVFGLAET